MKHASDGLALHTNLLQALQKNKIIQDKLNDYQRLHYVQLLKDMQVYSLEEKFNRELLYTWKKESYIRQTRKKLQEYAQQCYGVTDEYYESQVKNLGNMIAGQQTIAIPPSEEKRRLNINAKYLQFLQKNPLQATSLRATKIVNIPPPEKTKQEKEEEDNVRGLEKTWKHIHAQSATTSRRKQSSRLPTIQRSSTMSGFRRNQSAIKSLVSSSVPILGDSTNPELVSSSLGETITRLTTKSAPSHLRSSDSMEPLNISSDTLEKHTGGDLVVMRSVRRPRKNPAELNLLFETRKRVCEINRRAFDHHLCPRQNGFQQSFLFDRSKPVKSARYEENILPETDGETHKQQENTDPSDKITI